MRSPATRLLLVGGVLTLSVWLHAQVTEQDLRAGYKDASRWVTFSGDYTGQRHNPLTQIPPDNVGRLAVQWIFQGNPQGRLPASPLIYDGVIYMTGPNDSAWAIDARTGRQIWRYQRTLPNVVLCCGSINRGFAMLGDRVFKATLDAHIVALSMKTGAILWDTPMADYRQGYSATVAPIVVKDKVILGTAGGEYGARGFIDAYDAATGRRAWRFNVVPGPGESSRRTTRTTGIRNTSRCLRVSRSGQPDRQAGLGKRVAYAGCEGGGGATATAGGLVFHVEPDGNFQAYDGKTGSVLWQFQTGEAGFGGGAGPGGGSAVSYEVQGQQYIALTMNHRVWAFKAGGTVPPLPAPPAPPTAIQWEGRVEDASVVQLGVTATYNVVTAGRREEWNNADGISPPRVRAKAGATLTFRNGTKTARTIESRDGSWTTGVIKPGESAAVVMAKPGTYEYICKERPWSFGQLVVE